MTSIKTRKISRQNSGPVTLFPPNVLGIIHGVPAVNTSTASKGLPYFGCTGDFRWAIKRQPGGHTCIFYCNGDNTFRLHCAIIYLFKN
jgi:hypothetical protein